MTLQENHHWQKKRKELRRISTLKQLLYAVNSVSPHASYERKGIMYVDFIGIGLRLLKDQRISRKEYDYFCNYLEKVKEMWFGKVTG